MSPRQLFFAIHGRPAPRSPRRRPNGRGPARSWRYLAWIRSLPCAACGHNRNIEAAHTGTDGGKAQKSSDWSVIPLCQDCHQFAAGAYHRGGREEFERRNGLDLAELVKRLNRAYVPETPETSVDQKAGERLSDDGERRS